MDSFLEYGEVKVNIISCGIFQILSLLLCKPQCACSNLHCTRIPWERWHSSFVPAHPIFSRQAEPLTAPGAWRSLSELFWALPWAQEPLPASLPPGCMRYPGCGLLLPPASALNASRTVRPLQCQLTTPCRFIAHADHLLSFASQP